MREATLSPQPGAACFSISPIPKFPGSHQLHNVYYMRRGSGFFSQSYQFPPSFFHHFLLVFSAARCFSPLILLVHYCVTAALRWCNSRNSQQGSKESAPELRQYSFKSLWLSLAKCCSQLGPSFLCRGKIKNNKTNRQCQNVVT